MVHAVERFGEVNKDGAYRLAIIDSSMPMVHHVDQGMRSWPVSAGAELPVVQAVSHAPQNPRPDKRLENLSSSFDNVKVLMFYFGLKTSRY